MLFRSDKVDWILFTGRVICRLCAGRFIRIAADCRIYTNDSKFLRGTNKIVDHEFVLRNLWLDEKMSFCYFVKQGGEVDFDKCSKGSVIYLRVAIAIMCSYYSMNFNRLVAKARRIALLKYDLASVFAKEKDVCRSYSNKYPGFGSCEHSCRSVSRVLIYIQHGQMTYEGNKRS